MGDSQLPTGMATHPPTPLRGDVYQSCSRDTTMQRDWRTAKIAILHREDRKASDSGEFGQFGHPLTSHAKVRA